MIRSDTLAELNAALSAAQGEFEVVAKTAGNPFFKSKYAPLPDVVKAATPILTKHGLAVWQGGDTDDHGELLWTVVLHTSGEFIGSAARLLPVKGDPQAQGSAVTYQRRYQYMAALGLVADEDDDGNAASGRSSARSKPSSRRQSSTRPNPRTTTAQAVSGADNGSQGTTGGDDDSQPVSDDTLAEIRKAFKDTGATQADLKRILGEVGAEGKKLPDLTEDQGTWTVIKLREGK